MDAFNENYQFIPLYTQLFTRSDISTAAYLQDSEIMPPAGKKGQIVQPVQLMYGEEDIHRICAVVASCNKHNTRLSVD